jgi:hypothetical protein
MFRFVCECLSPLPDGLAEAFDAESDAAWWGCPYVDGVRCETKIAWMLVGKRYVDGNAGANMSRRVQAWHSGVGACSCICDGDRTSHFSFWRGARVDVEPAGVRLYPLPLVSAVAAREALLPARRSPVPAAADADAAAADVLRIRWDSVLVQDFEFALEVLARAWGRISASFAARTVSCPAGMRDRLQHVLGDAARVEGAARRRTPMDAPADALADALAGALGADCEVVEVCGPRMGGSLSRLLGRRLGGRPRLVSVRRLDEWSPSEKRSVVLHHSSDPCGARACFADALVLPADRPLPLPDFRALPACGGYVAHVRAAPRAFVHLLVDCPAGAARYAGTRRGQEFAECLRANSGSPFVRCVTSIGEHALPDDLRALPKVSDRPTGARLTYREAIRFAGEHAGASGVLVIANADIRLDHHTVARLEAIPRRTCWALSRWNRAGGGLELQPDAQRSQDAWAFRLPVHRDLHLYIEESLALGVPGCDNCISRIIQRCGFRVHNPCRSIVCVHEHEGWEKAVYNGSNVGSVVRHLHVEPAHL